MLRCCPTFLFLPRRFHTPVSSFDLAARVPPKYSSAGPLDGVDQWDYMMKTETASAKDSPRQEMLYNLDPYTKWSSNSG